MIGANAGRQTLVVNQSGDSLAEAVGCELASSQSTHAVVVLGDESYGIPSEAMEMHLTPRTAPRSEGFGVAFSGSHSDQ